MSNNEETEEIYDDHTPSFADSIAPLKRNHACLSCKKRKVKCDAIKPHCSPCLRSHAHAVRAAGRVGVRPPVICCEWAEADSPNSPDEPPALQNAGPAPRKKTSGFKKLPAEKEKARRQEDERETLLARIAELEARLNGSTPQSSEASGSGSRLDPSPPTRYSGSTSTDPSSSKLGSFAPAVDWDFSGLFMTQTNWPKNLPAPYLLEHLVQTFFNSVPQTPRMLNRPKLLARIRLPANHPSFPHPALLHAICAAAAQYTGWVTSVPLEALESGIKACHARGETLETFEDFALAQAEAANRSIHQTHQICKVGSPDSLFEIFQAEILISEVWMTKGMFLLGWSNGGQAARYVKGLELANRTQPRRYKSSMLPTPATAIEREERLCSTWLVFLAESSGSIGRYWSASLDDREMFCKLPAAADGRKELSENPQDAKDPKLYFEHPVHDPFVLICKAAMLCSRAARFIRDWAQRDVRPGDAMLGMNLELFKGIVRDVHLFQRTIPDEFKNVHRLQTALTAELLAIHMMPNITILMLYESFIDWERPQQGGLPPMLSAYENIMTIIHLIPSNADVSYCLTSDLSFNLHVVGRIIADFIRNALDKQSYDLAMRYRIDLAAIQSLLARYGAKSPLGRFSQTFLDNYLDAILSGREPESMCAERRPADDLSAVLDISDQTSPGGALRNGSHSTDFMGSDGFDLSEGAMAGGLDTRAWSLFEEGQILS